MTTRKQEMVNENLEQVFDLAPSVSDKMKNIVKSQPLENNQILQSTTPVKKKGRGGARANSGRKVGSTVKLSAADLLAEIARQDKPFAEGLAEDYVRARNSGDLHIVQRYQQMFLSKVLADKQEMDVTSNGHTVGANFSFPSVELPDWQNEQSTKH